MLAHVLVRFINPLQSHLGIGAKRTNVSRYLDFISPLDFLFHKTLNRDPVVIGLFQVLVARCVAGDSCGKQHLIVSGRQKIGIDRAPLFYCNIAFIIYKLVYCNIAF